MKSKLNQLLDSALARKGVKGKSGAQLNGASRLATHRRIMQNLKGSNNKTLNDLRFSEG